MAKFPNSALGPHYGEPLPEVFDESGRERFSRVRTFTRRGERMRPKLQAIFEANRKDYLLEFTRGFGSTTVDTSQRFSPSSVFGRQAPLVVEIGCGTGTQIVARAAERPDLNFLGFEVWLPGLASAVAGAVRSGGLPNLRLVEADAVQALPVLLAPGSVSELWSFFPDPWPKAKHHKRRLVSADFATRVAGLLQPGGLWRMATDWDDYAWQMRDVVEGEPLLENPHAGERPCPELDPEGSRGGFAPRWPGRIITLFEERALREGRQVRDVLACRRQES